MKKYSFLFLTLSIYFSCNFSNNSSNTQSIDSPKIESAANLEKLAKTAKAKGEWLKAAQLYEQLFEESPREESLNYEASTNYLKANYPKKALQLLINFDSKYQDKTSAFNGRIARIAKAYYQLGQYTEILNLVQNYNYPKMYRGLAREHLKALIQLKEFEKLSTFFSTYQQSGIYDDKGKSTNMGFLYRAICNELLLVEEKDLLAIYAQQYHEWAKQRLPKDQRNAAIALFYQQAYPQTVEQLKSAITAEKSARHQMELMGLLGICHAKNQQIEKAIAQIPKIHAMGDLPPRHDAFGAKYYHQARIEVALNQSANAIQSLKKALAEKAEFWSNRFREDGLMKNLFKITAFKELVVYN